MTLSLSMISCGRPESAAFARAIEMAGAGMSNERTVKAVADDVKTPAFSLVRSNSIEAHAVDKKHAVPITQPMNRDPFMRRT